MTGNTKEAVQQQFSFVFDFEWGLDEWLAAQTDADFWMAYDAMVKKVSAVPDMSFGDFLLKMYEQEKARRPPRRLALVVIANSNTGRRKGRPDGGNAA